MEISYILNQMHQENEKLKIIRKNQDFLKSVQRSTLSVEVSFYDEEQQMRRRITEYGSKAAYAMLKELQAYYENEETECNNNLNKYLEQLKSQ